VNTAPVPGEVQLEAWLTEYGDAVLRMCYLYLADRMLAEDAMQDTFVKVWRGMKNRRNESSAKTWILRIAINTCKDYRRTAWLKHIDRSRPVEDLPPVSADTTEVSRALFLDVLQLPAKYKQVISFIISTT
jgi:RNA polymerase sigma-70 factor (ECF subfamily)